MCYSDNMAKMIQIRNVPDDLHATLKARAAGAGMTLSDYLLFEIRHVAERPTPQEIFERLSKKRPIEVEEPPAAVIRRARDAGDPRGLG